MNNKNAFNSARVTILSDKLLSQLKRAENRIEGKLEEAEGDVTAIALILPLLETPSPELIEFQSELVAREKMLKAKLEKVVKRIELIDEICQPN